MRSLDRCPACGGGSCTVVAVADEDSRRRFLRLSQVKYGGTMDRWMDELKLAVCCCNACRHHWYPEQPDPHHLLAMYDAAKPLFGEPGTRQRRPSPHMHREMKRLRRLVRCRDSAPALLDYGSGFGRWPRAAAQSGFRVTAFEPSLERGSEPDTPFELVHELAVLHGRCFDAINVEQVLEHVSDPVGLLVSLRHFCHSSTVVRITVPNIDRSPEGDRLWSEWPFQGNRMHTLSPFEHLHGFTVESLRAVTARAGFAPLCGWRVWTTYPSYKIRAALGFRLRTLGQTQVLARVLQAGRDLDEPETRNDSR